MVLSPLKLGASLIKVFLFHKQNTCGNSLYIVTMCIFVTPFPIYGSACTGTILKCHPQNKETMLSTTLGFPICRRVTDHCSILVLKTIGFSQEFLAPWVHWPFLHFGAGDHGLFPRFAGMTSSQVVKNSEISGIYTT